MSSVPGPAAMRCALSDALLTDTVLPLLPLRLAGAGVQHDVARLR